MNFNQLFEGQCQCCEVWICVMGYYCFVVVFNVGKQFEYCECCYFCEM